MIIDSRLEFSVKQVLAATGASTNVIELSTDRDIGPGRTMWVVITADASPAAAVTVSLETSNTEGSGYAKVASVTVPQAAAIGSRYVLGVPYENQRYLRLDYSAAGTFSAFLTDQEPASWKAYPDAL